MTLSSAYRGTMTVTLAGQLLTLALRQVTNPVKVSLIRRQLGLNEGDAILEARLVTPRRKPDAVKAGMKVNAFQWAGRSGQLRLEPYQDAIPGEWRDRYGDRLIFSWTSDEV